MYIYIYILREKKEQFVLDSIYTINPKNGVLIAFVMMTVSMCIVSGGLVVHNV